MKMVLTVALAVGLAGCTPPPDCNALRRERATARQNLDIDENRARSGDSYAAASLSYDRDELRKAERRYDEACLK